MTIIDWFESPGLAIRVICAERPYMEKEFTETENLLEIIVNFCSALKKPLTMLNRLLSGTTEVEQAMLMEISQACDISSTLLPIRTVGVQGDCRSYSYVAGLSSDQVPDWSRLATLAKLIPRLCSNINRVVYIYGGRVRNPIRDITPTFLTETVLSTLRNADHVAYNVLRNSGCRSKISQMPLILIPIHFDRGTLSSQPSSQRSIVIRTFITSDFMTGIAAVPGKHIPEEVLSQMASEIQTIPGISRVMYDLTSKPPGTTEWE